MLQRIEKFPSFQAMLKIEYTSAARVKLCLPIVQIHPTSYSDVKFHPIRPWCKLRLLLLLKRTSIHNGEFRCTIPWCKVESSNTRDSVLSRAWCKKRGNFHLSMEKPSSSGYCSEIHPSMVPLTLHGENQPQFWS